MTQVFIVESKRTAIGSLGGVFSSIEAPKLAAEVIKNIVATHKFDPSSLDEVIMGQVLIGGIGQAPARQAMRLAEIPDSVSALTVSKVCGSGLMAIMTAVNNIRAQESELIIAGGMENMSLAPYFLKKARNGYRLGHSELLDLMIHDGLQDPYSGKHMGEVAEIFIEKYKISREEQDQFAIRSYKLAQAANNDKVFASEIVPFAKQEKSGTTIIDKDEEPFKVDFDKLVTLRPVFSKTGTITAANASSINDGAAAALIASESALKKHNLKPMGRIVAQACYSMHPNDFVMAPAHAIKKVLEKAKLSVKDIDLFEINEAFAAVPIIAMRECGIPLESVNVRGGACALGHPIGASGARITATLLSELGRRKGKYGLATLCIGGGEAVAVIFERV